MSLNSYSAKVSDYLIGQAARRQLVADKPLVLVVEDQEDTRFLFRAMLEITGCRVTEACNGLEAIEVAESEHPNLILIDGNLPLLDGLATARRLREHRELDEVPIVALSGDLMPNFHDAAIAAGCDDCLTKPIDFKTLENLLNRLFDITPDAA